MDKTITNSQQAFEAACAQLGYDPVTILPDVSMQPEWLQRYNTSNTKRLIIAEAINDGHMPKYDGIERHWFPVWTINENSPLGFSRSTSDCWFTNSDVGSRLEFFSREDSDYFGENFMDLHADVILYGK